MRFNWIMSSVFLATFFAASAAIQAATINVPADQPTIQAGIDAAVNGDEVVVADGVYNEKINFNGKAVMVRSVNGRGATTIDGTGLNDSVVTCDNGEDARSVLQGFTITGGTGNTTKESTANGGGMLNWFSSPLINNCLFTNNNAESGGGMLNHNSSPTILDCVFIDNIAFNPNATPTQAAGAGGGIHNRYNSSPTIISCAFSGNTADVGGGVRNFSFSSPTLINCLIAGNAAILPHGFGGGIESDDGTDPTLINCTLIQNTAIIGGGLFNDSDTEPNLVNCILWGNVSTTDPQIRNKLGGTIIVSYSNIQGGWPGIGNINADPLFVDAGNADFRLLVGSPCIDTGDNSFVSEVTDLDGNPRISNRSCGPDAIVDMGAYELPPSLGDQDGDGISDVSDNCPCYYNPTQEYNKADLDQDCDVDSNDFLTFTNCFNGALNPPACP